MSENEQPAGAEDLQLDESQAEAVVGGRAAVDPGDEKAYELERKLAELRAAGYVEESCTAQGTVMVNAQGQRRTVSI